MQITIGNLSLTGTIPAEQVQQFRLLSESQVQSTAALGADGIEQFLRGNKKLTISFTIQRQQTSAEEAAYFCLYHEAQFPLQGTLTYQTDSGELYLLGAVVVVTHAEFTGATTTHSYRATSGGGAATSASSGPPGGILEY